MTEKKDGTNLEQSELAGTENENPEIKTSIKAGPEMDVDT